LQGFISEEHNTLVVCSEPEELLQQVLAWKPPPGRKTVVQLSAAIGEDISKPSAEAKD
jgi:hypothetical protein